MSKQHASAMGALPVRLGTGDVLLLDGGMGQELSKRGVHIPPVLWSTHALRHAPEAVEALHHEYAQAGSDILTTCSFTVTPKTLERAGWPDSDLESLLHTAAALARRAADRAARRILVAGSLPPLDDCYRADRVASLEDMLPAYRRIAAALADRVDLFICETLSSSQEALAAATAAAETGLPVWVAWTLDDDRSGRLRGGESTASAIAQIAHLPIRAHLINCSQPEAVDVGLPLLRDHALGPVGVYANAIEEVPSDFENRSLAMRPEVTTSSYVAAAQRWIASGAEIIGGCCGIGPQTIAELRRLLAERIDGPPKAGAQASA